MFSGRRHDGEDNVNNDNNDNPFIEQSSRRAFKRRRHQSRQQVQQQQQSQRQQQPGPRISERRPGQGLLTGKLKYTLPGQRFKAAKNVIRKAVFCIDNVHPSVELDDLRLFVTGLSVEVLTCFPVKPRRRRYESDCLMTGRRFDSVLLRRTEIDYWTNPSGLSPSSSLSGITSTLQSELKGEVSQSRWTGLSFQ